MTVRSRPVGALARKELRANPSVVGFSETLKPKRVKGKPTAKLAIRVYVERKLPRSKVPRGLLLPRQIGGVPLDVEELGRVELAQAPPVNPGKTRPLKGGCSGSHDIALDCGTLGYFVRDRRTPPPPAKPQWYALSCAHVLNAPSTGGPPETLQPSPKDGGVKPRDVVGAEYLYTFNPVDAAIAKIDTGAVGEIIGLPAPRGMGRVDEGMTVAKSGRTTGVTFGTVIDDDFEWGGRVIPAVSWMASTIHYRGLILVENRHREFLERGDSGSLLIDPATELAVGLCFGVVYRHHGYGRAIAASIQNVMHAFPNQVLVAPGDSWP